jgi:hypothetical protein
MTAWQKRTVAFIIGVVIVIIIYDIVAAALGGQDATISVIITKYSRVWPTISFAFGFLMGHFFAQNSTPT